MCLFWPVFGWIESFSVYYKPKLRIILTVMSVFHHLLTFLFVLDQQIRKRRPKIAATFSLKFCLSFSYFWVDGWKFVIRGLFFSLIFSRSIIFTDVCVILDSKKVSKHAENKKTSRLMVFSQNTFLKRFWSGSPRCKSAPCKCCWISALKCANFNSAYEEFPDVPACLS